MTAEGDRLPGTDADRLHTALIKSFVAGMPAVPGSWISLREGYAASVCPPIPFPGFNGLWIDGDVALAELTRAIGEVEAAGVQCWLFVRASTSGPFDATAKALGFHLEESVPGMAVTPDELVASPAVDAAIRRIGAQDLDPVIDVGAEGFGGPRPPFAAMYASIAATPGFAIYEARAHDTVVSTSVGWLGDGTVGIFNVTTPPTVRRRGYGRAVTERAVRDGFQSGADLAWLQSSELGASVYRAMGFREVEMYRVYARDDAPVG